MTLIITLQPLSGINGHSLKVTFITKAYITTI